MFKIFGSGRLGRDAETRDVGDTSVTVFSVALDGYGGGEKVTTWIECALWGARGAKVAPMLSKGTSIAFTGTGRLEIYDKRDGGQGAKITCRVDDWSFAGPRQDAGAAPSASSGAKGNAFDDDKVPF